MILQQTIYIESDSRKQKLYNEESQAEKSNLQDVLEGVGYLYEHGAEGKALITQWWTPRVVL